MLLAFATDFYQWDPPLILKESHCHIVCPSIEAAPVYVCKRGCLIWNLYAFQPVASPTVTPLHSLQGPSDLEIQFATSTYAASTHLWTFLHGGLIWQLLVTGDSISFISPWQHSPPLYCKWTRCSPLCKALSCKLPQHAWTIHFCRTVPPVEKPKESGKYHVLKMSELSAEFNNGSKSGWWLQLAFPLPYCCNSRPSRQRWNRTVTVFFCWKSTSGKIHGWYNGYLKANWD